MTGQVLLPQLRPVFLSGAPGERAQGISAQFLTSRRNLAQGKAAPHIQSHGIRPIISASIGDDVAGFVAEQAGVSDAYAAQVLDDHARFVKALSAIGPRLGVPFDEADRPPPDLEALFGEP